MNRRQFIGTGTLAAGAMLPGLPLHAAEPRANVTLSKKYVPRHKGRVVVKPGEFVFGAAYADHAHLYDQCGSLIEAGGTLKWIHEPDVLRLAELQKRFPQAKVARSLDEILADAEVKLVTTAAIPCERGPIGCRVMDAGKDYFTDKASFTTLGQLAEARAVSARTGRKYMVYYNERLRNEAGMFATDLLRDGVIGRVVNIMGLGPHRLGLFPRPAWFYELAKYGGILCDIGSHKCEVFLTFAGATDATVVHAAVGNFANPKTPELEDFAEATFVANNGATCQMRIDWYTPDGLPVWGDGRTFILGTRGYIELRSYVDVARDKGGGHVYIVDQEGEHYVQTTGKVGYPFFGDLILDCLHRTENAMTQAHAFKAAELSLQAQAMAKRLT